MNTFDTLISAIQLQSALTRHTDGAEAVGSLVVLDCRAQLGNPEAGPKAWATGHIPGAQHANLERDLAAPAHSVGETGGGRHPLPDRAEFSARCAAWGISKSTQVVAYDDAGGAYAARAWWLLRWLGHASVAVLDGGIQAFEKLPSGALTTQSVLAAPAQFEPQEPLTRIADLSEIETLVSAQSLEGDHSRSQLIDARTQQRFDGEMEPIDPVAGHIPGAQCFFHAGNLGDDGLFLSPQQLSERFESVRPDPDASSHSHDLICYCGSGVTAAHNVLAAKIAGLPEPKLYVGSWSEWCSDLARPRVPPIPTLRS